MKICCQIPVTMPEDAPGAQLYYAQLQEHFAKIKRPDTEVWIKSVAGPAWEPAWETYIGLHPFNNIEILKSMLDAEKKGCDGVSIACFFDPALSEARQLLNIPVVGVAEASMHFAYLMGSKFAVIVRDRYFVSSMEAQIDRYGMEAKAIKHNPVRGLTLPEEQLAECDNQIFNGNYQDLSALVDNFKDVARGCIEDGAEVLIMGCGLLSPVLQHVGLMDVDDAVLIEPMQASLKLIEIMVDLNKAGIPFVSRRSTYLDVPPKYISDVLASRAC